ncbi:DUF971 domain-containing protein [Pseudoduganella sp. UC29_106]|uniref:DUF971 domain-containing protein n=1 Tax=Pseudoduganella sp. UC29_106 TaxID=3374553 RepID=UPI0037583E19
MTPLSISRGGGIVEIEWPDAARQQLDDALLRRSCRCADCTAARRRNAETPVAPDVRLLDIRPVGSYAVLLVFSDGHERGIYPWPYLKGL